MRTGGLAIEILVLPNFPDVLIINATIVLNIYLDWMPIKETLQKYCVIPAYSFGFLIHITKLIFKIFV